MVAPINTGVDTEAMNEITGMFQTTILLLLRFKHVS